MFILSNYINAEQKEKLSQFLTKFCATDPMDYFIEQMEKNAMEDSEESRMGFLTMILDYGATLAWKFEQNNSGINIATTMAKLPIRKG